MTTRQTNKATPAQTPADDRFAGLVRVLREYHALWPHNAASTATHAQLVAYMLAASHCWNERIAPLVKAEWYRQLDQEGQPGRPGRQGGAP